MKSRFILFRRAGVFYSKDTVTRKQSSLRTKDEAEAVGGADYPPDCPGLALVRAQQDFP
jgi:hypothetical protein